MPSPDGKDLGGGVTGQGFKQSIQTFEIARTQTAARAVGGGTRLVLDDVASRLLRDARILPVFDGVGEIQVLMRRRRRLD